MGTKLPEYLLNIVSNSLRPKGYSQSGTVHSLARKESLCLQHPLVPNLIGYENAAKLSKRSRYSEQNNTPSSSGDSLLRRTLHDIMFPSELTRVQNSGLRKLKHRKEETK